MLKPSVSSQPPFASYGDNNSWIKVEHDLGSRALYAQAVYNVNPSNAMGMNGFIWVTENQTVVGPFAAVLLTTTQNGETHVAVTSLTSLSGNVASNLVTIAGTYIYNVQAITLGSKAGAIAYY
jgi:hypothetical protein